MSPALAHQRCRLYGEFIPLDEVPIALANGWRLLDELAHDPLGARCVLMAPPPSREREAAA
jgi:hypothetical protein